MLIGMVVRTSGTISKRKNVAIVAIKPAVNELTVLLIANSGRSHTMFLSP